jgi:hypothetical protein
VLQPVNDDAIPENDVVDENVKKTTKRDAVIPLEGMTAAEHVKRRRRSAVAKQAKVTILALQSVYCIEFV